MPQMIVKRSKVAVVFLGLLYALNTQILSYIQKKDDVIMLVHSHTGTMTVTEDKDTGASLSLSLCGWFLIILEPKDGYNCQPAELKMACLSKLTII